MNSFESLSPREAYAAYMMGSILVDVQENPEFETKSIDVKKLVKLPFSQLNQRFNELPQHRQVVFLSRVGVKSKRAAKFLMENGYQNVATLDGGLAAWEEEGLPVR